MSQARKQNKNSNKLSLWTVHSLMIMAAVIVSSSFTIGAAITRGLDPVVLTLVRFVLAVLFLAPILYVKHGLVVPSLRQLRGYAAISVTTVGFFWCMFESLRYTTAINTSVIFTLVPGISGIYSAVFLGERLGRNRLWALFVGMAGALWVIFRGDISCFLAMDINYGDILFLGGCFLMAAYTPLVKRMHQQESMMVMTFWVLVTGVGWLLILSLPKLHTIDWQGVPNMVWTGIIYLGLFSTVITFYLTHTATLYLGPTRVMAYSYFYPAFVLAIDWGLGHGLPQPIIMPGVVVVTLATVVVQRGSEK